MTTLSIEVRRADPRDARAIAAVHRSAWIAAYAGMIPHRPLVNMIERRREDWWRRAARGPSTVLVLDVAIKVAGYATIGLNRVRALKQEGEIYALYLLPEYQGIGLGSYLFRECRGILRANDDHFRIMRFELFVVLTQLRHVPAAVWSDETTVEDQDDVL